MERPKLEIIRAEDGVEIYLGGKEVMSYVGHVNRLDLIEETARVVAEALGANVGKVEEPTPQPHRYYVVFAVAVKHPTGLTFDYIPAVRWVDLPKAIEGPEDFDALCAEVAGKVYPVENVRVINFIYIDGPC